MSKIHHLKTWPGPFGDVKERLKTFEVRRNDRRFAKGDLLVLHEWSPLVREYTNEKPLIRLVTYVLPGGGPFGVADDHVVMSIDTLDERDAERILLSVLDALPGESPTPSEGRDG